MIRIPIAVAFLAVGASAAQEASDPVFHAGTRLVEVNVVVRHQRVRPKDLHGKLHYWLDTGPPFGPAGEIMNGLRKQDFTVLDNGIPQPISVFHAGAANQSLHMEIPPGAVSNRIDARGKPVNNPTVILIDLLNTHFEFTDYARQGLRDLLKTLEGTDTQLALFSLGEQLHLLHDFTDDPHDLDEISAVLNHHQGKPTGELRRAMRDFGDIYELEGGEEVAAQIHGRITARAMRKIVQHLSGMPGRKNLIWLSQAAAIPARMAAMLQAANIVVYPVVVRCSWAPCGFAAFETSVKGEGTVFGGRGFFDARDLVFAFQSAQEDSESNYVLGYYPPEEALDGKYHNITVKVDRKALELHYRAGYMATKIAMPVPPPRVEEVLENPLDAGGIGLAAQATPEPGETQLYDVHVIIDLHDVYLEHTEGHSKAVLEFSVPDPAGKNAFKTGTVLVDVADGDLPDKMAKGYSLMARGVGSDMGEIRLIVRDRATGLAGSLRLRTQ